MVCSCAGAVSVGLCTLGLVFSYVNKSAFGTIEFYFRKSFPTEFQCIINFKFLSHLV